MSILDLSLKTDDSKIVMAITDERLRSARVYMTPQEALDLASRILAQVEPFVQKGKAPKPEGSPLNMADLATGAFAQAGWDFAK